MDYKSSYSNILTPRGQVEVIKGDVDHIYVNVILTNTKDFDIPAQIKDTRYANILERANEWKMSIVRFSISANEIPIFRPVIPNPALPLQSNMSLTFGYAGTYVQRFVQATAQEVAEGVFSYSNWLQHINEASRAAFAALLAAQPGLPSTEPPLFYLDAKSSLISMYVQNSYLQSNPNHVELYLNQQLQNILDLPFARSYTVPAAQGRDFELAVTESATLLPVAPRVGYPYALNLLSAAQPILQVSQEFPSLDEWNDAQRLFFTTGHIPVNGELLPNSPTPEQQGNVSRSSQQIVTDFLINREGPEPTRHAFTYIPSVYRYVSLLGAGPLKDIDIQAWVQSYTGEMYPIKLAPRTNMSMKIMFERRECANS